ncbi:MAG: sulfoxide reductase heme-binding subunit YedZ [Gammaproteobacteria bacterium]|nr:sulfoxide reductase heme-binding subunit YedZ [Gammaproteobacteria bacterium]
MGLPRFRLSKVVFWCVLAIPLGLLANDIRIELSSPTLGLGADPEDAIVDHLGIWSIRYLWFTLFISSLARLAKKPMLVQFRRMAGLWTFFMVLIHVTSYVLLFARVDFATILSDFTERPYIIAGLTGLCMLIPLAITSTRGWRRRLRQDWTRLHRLVYVAAIAGWIHLFWLERASFEESAIYGGILLLLFGERLFQFFRKRHNVNAANAQSAS